MSRLEELMDEQECDFNLPPSKTERRKYFGGSLIKKWISEFKERVWFIPHYPVVSFHVLFGQLPNVKNTRINVGKSSEDCRIHMLLLQESGSGKGGGFSFMNKMCEKTGIIFHNVGDVTNNALIGTLQPNGDGGTKVLPGVLDPRYNDGQGVDIVACNEASGLIDTRKDHFDKNALLNLQRAMNRIGTADNVITKETAVGEEMVKFNTDVSFYLTTFEPKKMFETMTETGLLQRLVVIYNPISLKDKWKVAKKHASLVEADVGDRDSDINNIVSALRYINNCYEGIDSLELTSKARKGLKNKVLPMIYKPLLKLDSHTMNEVKKFSTRYQVMLYRFAWHHAMARLSKTVEVEDIAYARKVFIPIYRELVAYMENKFKVSKEEKVESKSQRNMINKIYSQLAQDSSTKQKRPWIRKAYIVGKLGDRWGVSRQSARQRLERHISMFKTDISKSNSVILKMRDLG